MEQLYIPYLILRHHVDLVHSWHYSFPLFTFGAKKIVTIHDMTFFLYPELHTRTKTRYFRMFTRLAARRADGLIFNSRSTLDDFVKLIGECSAPAAVVHIASKEDLVPVSDKNAIAGVKEKFGIGERFVLFIGTIEPRKNLPRLLNAFERFVNDGFDGQLVIAGKKGWHCDDLLNDREKLRDRIVLTGFVSDFEKACLLSSAISFVYPSIYEGFGIPVLEAMSFGLPTLTSNISSMPEVAGDAALLIDPLDEDQMYGSLTAVCCDESLRQTLSEKSLVRSRQFTWSKAAQVACQMYEEVGATTPKTSPNNGN